MKIPSKSHKKIRLFTIISTILTAIFIFFAIALLTLGLSSIKRKGIFQVFGYSFSTVASPSMEGTIMVNDIIIIKETDFSSIKVGDIIVYRNESLNKNIVHRVIEIDNDGSLITKGDNNSVEDDLHTTKDNYIGLVVKYGSFWGIGKLLTSYRSLIFIIIICIFFYIIISEIFNVIININKKRLISKQNQQCVVTFDKEEMKEELLLEIKKELEEKNKNKK